MALSTWLANLASRSGSREYAPLRTDRLASVSTVASEASSPAYTDDGEDGDGNGPAHESTKERLTHADLDAEASRPARSKRGRLALAAFVVGSTVALSLTATTLVRPSATAPGNGSAWAPPCSASGYSTGRWVAREPAPADNATIWTSTGFTGCAQSWFRNDWHLGRVPPSDTSPAAADGTWPMSDYRRRAGGWEWLPEDETCAVLDDDEAKTSDGRGEQVLGVDVVRLLQDLVDRGGWLIVGDSLSEQHFFSLGCLLFPHVRALWPYSPMSVWHQIKEEHLFLDPASPLLASGALSVPAGFDFEGSPLVSHVRTDHGLAPSELIDVYSSFYSSAPPALAERYPALASLTPHEDRRAILTDVETFSPSLDYYLDLFLRPSSWRNITTGISPSYAPETTPPESLAVERNATRSAHYRALIFSTGAHFSSRHFTLPDGNVAFTVPSAVDADGTVLAAHEGRGNAHVEFFELVVNAWGARVSAALRDATPEEREGKVVLVRPSSGGHNDCHKAVRPVAPGEAAKSDWYSWADMAKMNKKAGALVDQLKDPQIAFLDLVKPASLRPDAHTNDDCLHLSTGTGVIEGWTRYMAFYLRERGAHEDEARRAARGWMGWLRDDARWPF